MFCIIVSIQFSPTWVYQHIINVSILHDGQTHQLSTHQTSLWHHQLIEGMYSAAYLLQSQLIVDRFIHWKDVSLLYKSWGCIEIIIQKCTKESQDLLHVVGSSSSSYQRHILFSYIYCIVVKCSFALRRICFRYKISTTFNWSWAFIELTLHLQSTTTTNK